MTGVRRLLALVGRLVGTILVITFAVTAAIEISLPGGFRSVVFAQGLPPASLRSARQQALVDTFALDDNMVERWLKWLANAVQGDLGVSNSKGGTTVVDLMAPRFSISIQLMMFATMLAICIGIPLGIFAALMRERVAGNILDGTIGLFQSVPLFVTPLFLIWLFAVELRWFPAASWVRVSDSVPGNLKALFLPGIALALPEIGYIARVVKSDIVHVLQMDFITAALSKGLSPSYVLYRHALRPASLGLLNVLGLNIGALLAGSFVIEFIFGIGALGGLFLGAIYNRDLHLVLATTTYVVSVYVVLNVIVDALMHAADPRIRRR